MEKLEDSEPIKGGVTDVSFTLMGKKKNELGTYIKSSLSIWIK